MTDRRVRARVPLFVGGLFAAVGSAGLSRCGGADPEAVYLSGDFLEARRHYNPAACAELKGDLAKRCNERAVEVTEALVGAAQYLGKRANDRIRRDRQIQFNQYNEAIRSLELALKILPAEHSLRPDFTAGIERIRATQGALEGELNLQLARLKTMLETSTYEPEVWTEIQLTFERVRVLVLAIGKPDDRPRALAMELFEKFRGHGQYEHARMAADLAEAVDTARPTAARHTDKDLIQFGVTDHHARQQEAARKKKIVALVREVGVARDARRPEVAVDKAREVLRLGPTGRTARQMRTILAQIEGVKGQVQRAKEARRVIAETVTDVAPVPLGEMQTTPADDDVEVAAVPVVAPAQVDLPPADQRPPALRLKEILRQYENKQFYEALANLEALYRDAPKAREAKKVAQLRQVWAPDRKRLTTELVSNADRLFVHEDESSLGEYKRAQRLAPEGEVALHVKERIETLQWILSD
ncbi:MAG: hypothetical protein HY903_16665 [Deltaproteobacteria bacterium]|nr:hypothetical protein [Deltaproteobacteria bacterium]